MTGVGERSLVVEVVVQRCVPKADCRGDVDHGGLGVALSVHGFDRCADDFGPPLV